MSYHWLDDLETHKDTQFYNVAIKLFSRLTSNPLFKYLGKEDHLQIKVAAYMAAIYPSVLMHHSPNEGKRTPIEQLRVKYFGVQALPDVMIYEKGFTNSRPDGNSELTYIGLAIELKILPNRPTDNQLNILNKLENSGWKVAVCYTLEETILEINKYLK